MSLRNRFRVVLVGATFGMLALASAWVFNERTHLLAERKSKTRALVDAADSVVTQFYDKELEGSLSQAEAQKQALETLEHMRYDQTDYFWVHDMDVVMVMHPFRPELDGKDLLNYRDPTGKTFFIEMTDLVRTQGSGFVTYKWPRPGQNEPVDKISFVKGFKPWGWILGSGIYLDDVQATWHHDLLIAALLTLVCISGLLAGSETTSGSIFRRLNTLIARFKDLAQKGADATLLLDIGHMPDAASSIPDELDQVMLCFNEMLLENRKRGEALVCHQETLERNIETRTGDLRKANVQLAAAHADIKVFLSSIPSILIGMDPAGKITRWNENASGTFGVPGHRAIGRRLDQCGIKWLHRDITAEITGWLQQKNFSQPEDLAYERDAKVHFVGLSVRPIRAQGIDAGYIVTGTDITEKKSLEEQLRQAQKLEAVGQLAAGVAHEINTPAQFVTSNTQFLKESWQTMSRIMAYCRRMRQEAVELGSVSVETLATYEELLRQSDIDYLTEEIPFAIDQSLEGLQRVAKIVRAMNEFSHPGGNEKQPVDINRVIETTVAVAHNEWCDVADMIRDLDKNLPLVPCLEDEVNQVVLNLIVNAAHAIVDRRAKDASSKGIITITSRRAGHFAEISVGDTGIGIPENVKSRIFEPFFSTKPMGKGTGQGLTLAHTVVVEKHQGQIWFETKPGEGTTFFVRLPLQCATAKSMKADASGETQVRGQDY